jgi:phospholipid/cholesterol/gamma-HCH transport system permease protein
MNIFTKITNIIENTGRVILDAVNSSGYALILMLHAIYYLKNSFYKRREILKQMYNAGVKTLAVVSVVALFTGMILALQSGLELKKFHLEENIGNLIVATMTREMGPFITAIILIAAVGSSMAAELATMKVSEELDALDIMSINVVKFLVMPRIVALSIMLPLITVYTNVIGCLGGAIVSVNHLNVPFDTYYMHMMQSLHFKAVYVGLLKSFVFGLSISSISCSFGLQASQGAIGVGRATRSSVVVSFVVVLIAGYFITEIFYSGNL